MITSVALYNNQGNNHFEEIEEQNNSQYSNITNQGKDKNNQNNKIIYNNNSQDSTLPMMENIMTMMI